MATGLWDSREGWNGQVAVDGLDLDTLSEFAGVPLGGKLSLTGYGHWTNPEPGANRLRIEGARIDAVDLGSIQKYRAGQGTPPGSGT